MKLFIFEGVKREPQVFDILERLFFPPKDDNQRVICCYNSNIYSLYQHYMKYGEGTDIVSVLRETMQGREDSPFTDDMLVSDFGEIYLFFDYDFHDNRFTINEINQRLTEMLMVFNDETSNGKLYISYPMIEALRYTKKLPDKEYINYIVSRRNSHNFKQLSADFSYYKDGWSFISLCNNVSENIVRKNWQLLGFQNVLKANWLCTGLEIIPTKHDVISQQEIFKSQREKYVIPLQAISVLSAFAIFLYDYCGSKIFENIEL